MYLTLKHRPEYMVVMSVLPLVCHFEYVLDGLDSRPMHIGLSFFLIVARETNV